MKSYPIYRYIRQRAMIFGLPVALFALQVLCVVCSLLVIIFSFHIILLCGLLATNLLVYGLLLKLSQDPQLLASGFSFPRSISNKKVTCFKNGDEPK